MQQLPMAFINIALGGKNAAVNSLGKSLSNDDFGQILGSVQDGEDWLQQSLVDRLGAEQLAQLKQQLAVGMSLPEAASIHLQQQRQAADLPPTPLESLPEGDEATASGRLGPQTGLPWPLSQYLSVTPEPMAPALSVANPSGSDLEEAEWAASGAVPTAPITPAEVPAAEAFPGLSLSPNESVSSGVMLGLPKTPHSESGPIQSGPTVASVLGDATGVSPTGADETLSSLPRPWSYRSIENASPDFLAPPKPAIPPMSMDALPPTPAPVSRIVPPADAPLPVATRPLVDLMAAGRAQPSVPSVPVAPDAEAGETAVPTTAPLVSTLRALWRHNEPSLPNVSSSAVGAIPRPESAVQTPVMSSAAVAPHAPPPELPFGFLVREGQSAPNPALAVQPQAGSSGANPLAELVADTLSNRSAARSELSSPADRPVVNVLGGATGFEAAGAGVSRATASPARDLAVGPRLNEPGWSQALGERLVLMAGRDQQTAEIKLNPAHLGPLEVKLSLHQDQATVSFLSQHAPVREALEQAIPRLREMFHQQDLQLVNVDVGQRREQATGGDGTGRDHRSEAGPNRLAADSEPAAVIDVPINSRGDDSGRRLDLYA